jgi:hypothetical protein
MILKYCREDKWAIMAMFLEVEKNEVNDNVIRILQWLQK